MNRLIHILLKSPLVWVIVFIWSCSQKPGSNFESYGEPLEYTNVASLQESLASLSTGDTAIVKLEATVREVCQAKGCWMTLESDKKVRVTFKDYGFFVPKDVAGKKVVVEGKVVMRELSEEMARHYADDAGVEYTEEMRKEISIVASGVLLEKTIQL